MSRSWAERRLCGALYGRTATEITGALQPSDTRVRYRRAYTRSDDWRLRILGLLPTWAPPST